MASHIGIQSGDKNGLTVQEGGYFHMTSRKRTRERIETMNESGVTVEDDPLPYVKNDLEGSGTGRPSFASVIAASVSPGALLLHTVQETEVNKGKSTFKIAAERYDNDS
jgi:hypothetical protein